ncbi:MAG: glycosyltransferase [Geminicoccaceae bacterium]
MAHSLFFFPDYRGANPYQRLMYAHAAPELHPQAGTITEALARTAQSAPGERVIFHLHWEDAVYRNEPDEDAALRAAETFLDQLERFLDAGGFLVWTMHNAAPHDGRYLRIHQLLLQWLPEMADLVHVHSQAAADHARRVLEIEPARIAVIPHGNYRPLYRRIGLPVVGSRAVFGLGPEDRVLLLFGRLGSYKGGEDLLAAFAGTRSNLRLVIAGKQIHSLRGAVDALPAERRDRVVVIERFIGEEEVPALFHAADAVALPYRSILTSGAAMLALSLRRPVIAPGFPALRELLEDGRDSLLFAPGSVDDLSRALDRFGALDEARLAALQSGAGATADRYDWQMSGLLLSGLYYRLLTMLRPQRRLAPPVALATEPAGVGIEPTRADAA